MRQHDKDAVVVIGAGLAGLTAAATAARAGRPVVVVEAHTVGGRARTDLRGSFDLITAISDSSATGSWLQVISGLAELLLGFWAAGSWGLSAVVLVSWVGAAAFLHGLAEIVGAFRLRDLAQ
jgi:glycine/D-amino acid oxidase-like deaminating enzyme